MGIPLGVTALCAYLIRSFDQANLVMVYMFGVAYVALTFGRGEAVVASFLSVLAFDTVCSEPMWQVNGQYALALVVMVAIAFLINSLSQRLRAEIEATAERERSTAALYRLSKELSRLPDPAGLAEVSRREIEAAFGCQAAIFLTQRERFRLVTPAASDGGFGVDEAVLAMASEAMETDTVRSRENGVWLFPLRATDSPVGVLAIQAERTRCDTISAQEKLLETWANTIGAAIERAFLARKSHEATLQAEGQKTRVALLRSVSHDLRSPLAAIAGAARAFAEGKGESKQLASTIYEESVRLNLQVQNLLDMTRFQSGEIVLNREWHALEELVEVTVPRIAGMLAGRDISVSIPVDLPLVLVDGDLVLKVLLNLLENAAVHTPSNTPIEIVGGETSDHAWISVRDRGPGVPERERIRIFQWFVQASVRTGPGVGLGLPICETIMKLHGGSIRVENRSDLSGTDEAGAVFTIYFPISETPPEAPHD